TAYVSSSPVPSPISTLSLHDALPISLTGQRLAKLYDMIDMVIENQTLRVATGVLNEIMTEAVALQQPPSDKGKRLKLYYITQVRSEEHTSELQSRFDLVCRLLLETKK